MLDKCDTEFTFVTHFENIFDTLNRYSIDYKAGLVTAQSVLFHLSNYNSLFETLCRLIWNFVSLLEWAKKFFLTKLLKRKI